MPAKNKTPQKSPPTPEREAGAAGYDDLLQSITGLAADLQALNQQAVGQYTPIVENILRSRSRDIRHVEHTLDVTRKLPEAVLHDGQGGRYQQRQTTV
jgi:hypothetical protein